MARSAALTQLPTSSRLIRVNGRTLWSMKGPDGRKGRKRGRGRGRQGDGKGERYREARETKRRERAERQRDRTVDEEREK